MKTSSAKAKGRRACQEVKEAFHEWAPDLKDDDIIVTPSGVPGEDLRLSPAARDIYPYVVECKNVEKLNVHEAYQQAAQHWIKRGMNESEYPLLAFKKNRSDLFVMLSLKDFLKLTR
ncbi:hypothetical protein D3C87_124850 [compost metagenome]